MLKYNGTGPLGPKILEKVEKRRIRCYRSEISALHHFFVATEIPIATLAPKRAARPIIKPHNMMYERRKNEKKKRKKQEF